MVLQTLQPTFSFYFVRNRKYSAPPPKPAQHAEVGVSGGACLQKGIWNKSHIIANEGDEHKVTWTL